MEGEPGNRHNVRTHNAQDFSDGLNPLSLGTMSASAYIENVAYHLSCLINYQELTRSI